MAERRREKVTTEGVELSERVVQVNRVAKVVKGGRRFSFSALVVVGNEVDAVGVGHGKANEVPLAIQKAVDDAKKNMFRVPRYGSTITHEVIGHHGAGRVLLKPAAPGTGVIAGGGVRAVLELAGVRDILSKSLGTTNPVNLVTATVNGLKSLRTPEEVAKLRGKTVAEVLGTSGGSTKPADEVVAERGKDGAAQVREMLGGLGADHVLECVGTGESMKQALLTVRPGGRVGYVGVPHDVQLNVPAMFARNVGIAGGIAPVRAYLDELLPDVLDGTVQPGAVFDLTLPLDEVAEGYRAMDERRAVKTLLTT